MDNFPFLLLLFGATMAIVLLYAAKTRKKADDKLDEDTPDTARMPEGRSRTGKVIGATMESK